jgi:hypothetical protein
MGIIRFLKQKMQQAALKGKEAVLSTRHYIRSQHILETVSHVSVLALIFSTSHKFDWPDFFKLPDIIYTFLSSQQFQNPPELNSVTLKIAGVHSSEMSK